MADEQSNKQPISTIARRGTEPLSRGSITGTVIESGSHGTHGSIVEIITPTKERIPLHPDEFGIVSSSRPLAQGMYEIRIISPGYKPIILRQGIGAENQTLHLGTQTLVPEGDRGGHGGGHGGEEKKEEEKLVEKSLPPDYVPSNEQSRAVPLETLKDQDKLNKIDYIPGVTVPHGESPITDEKAKIQSYIPSQNIKPSPAQFGEQDFVPGKAFPSEKQIKSSSQEKGTVDEIAKQLKSRSSVINFFLRRSSSEDNSAETPTSTQGFVDRINNLKLLKRFAKPPRILGGSPAQAFRGIGGPARFTGIIARAAPLFTNPITWIIIAVVLILLLVFIIVLNKGKLDLSSGGSSSSGGGGTTSSTNPIPGLELKLSAAKDQVNNGENIVYTVAVSYNSSSPIPIDTITIYEEVPSSTEFIEATGEPDTSDKARIKWSLAKDTNRTSFTFTLKPLQPDITVVNKVFARTSYIPPGGGGTCKEGTGFCSVEHLTSFFGSDARNASIVCNGESGGNPGALNTNCDTNDYRVGLFQINLVAHCPGAYGPGRWGTQSCDNLISSTKRDECEQRFKNPDENIRKALEIVKSKGSWSSDWGAAKACNIR